MGGESAPGGLIYVSKRRTNVGASNGGVYTIFTSREMLLGEEEEGDSNDILLLSTSMNTHALTSMEMSRS